ncbi:MAG: hypothetical protein IKF64_03110 [Eubacterium sp.]|nr:hypothetical protein [Eubacterium sp.]
MGKMKLNKSQYIGSICVALIVLAQAFEKIFEVAVTPSQATALICAMVYTLLVAVVYFIMSKNESSFVGIFVSILAVKMLPPNITYITRFSVDGAMLYFIVTKVCVVLFLLLAYKFYREQDLEVDHIRGMTILMILAAVPFFNQISAFTSAYFETKTGTMIMPFLSNYACYIAASLVILYVAYRSGQASMRFAAYFEFCAFGINIVRQLGKICYFAVTHQHISKSLFGWIIVFAGLIAVTAVLYSKSKKMITE